MTDRRDPSGEAPEPGADDPTWARLEDQIAWYDRKSTAAQHAYRRLKLLEVVVAASISVVAGISAPAALTASLGGVVVVLEALQHVYGYHDNWILYRSTTEALRHERYLYLANAGPYARRDRHRVLAERIEGLISQEHAKWTESREASVAEREAD
jgi:Protein of unknown function (DUF4231)